MADNLLTNTLGNLKRVADSILDTRSRSRLQIPNKQLATCTIKSNSADPIDAYIGWLYPPSVAWSDDGPIVSITHIFPSLIRNEPESLVLSKVVDALEMIWSSQIYKAVSFEWIKTLYCFIARLSQGEAIDEIVPYEDAMVHVVSRGNRLELASNTTEYPAEVERLWGQCFLPYINYLVAKHKDEALYGRSERHTAMDDSAVDSRGTCIRRYNQKARPTSGLRDDRRRASNLYQGARRASDTA